MSVKDRVRRLEAEAPKEALTIRVVIRDPDAPTIPPKPGEAVIRVGGEEWP